MPPTFLVHHILALNIIELLFEYLHSEGGMHSFARRGHPEHNYSLTVWATDKDTITDMMVSKYKRWLSGEGLKVQSRTELMRVLAEWGCPEAQGYSRDYKIDKLLNG